MTGFPENGSRRAVIQLQILPDSYIFILDIVVFFSRNRRKLGRHWLLFPKKMANSPWFQKEKQVKCTEAGAEKDDKFLSSGIDHLGNNTA